MPNFNLIADKNNTYDAIVIGSGISGGWAAKELCEKGLKTLVLERGRMVVHVDDYPTMMQEHWELEHRGKLTAEDRQNYHIQTRSNFISEDNKHSALFVGYAVSTTALSNLFISCKSEVQLDWKPVFLSNNQARTISEMTECILPRTKTPGEKDLHIDRFIDKMLKDLLSTDEQKDFVEGLNAFESASKSQNGASFAESTPQQQTAFLQKMDKETAKLDPSVWSANVGKAKPTPFYRRVKALTLLGYYTSQDIGEKVLSFDPIPGVFIGCMPLAQVGNTWNE